MAQTRAVYSCGVSLRHGWRVWRRLGIGQTPRSGGRQQLKVVRLVGDIVIFSIGVAA